MCKSDFIYSFCHTSSLMPSRTYVSGGRRRSQSSARGWSICMITAQISFGVFQLFLSPNNQSSDSWQFHVFSSAMSNGETISDSPPSTTIERHPLATCGLNVTNSEMFQFVFWQNKINYHSGRILQRQFIIIFLAGRSFVIRHGTVRTSWAKWNKSMQKMKIRHQAWLTYELWSTSKKKKNPILKSIYKQNKT